MLFSEITGLEDIKKGLTNSVANDHVAHAQMFLGGPGSGNLSLAMAFAQYINCENPSPEESCGQCPSCSKYQKLIHPDLHFIYPTASTKEVKEAVSANFMEYWRNFTSSNPYPIIQDWAQYIDAENKQVNISVEESRRLIRSLSLKSFEAKYKVVIIWLAEHMNTSAANSLLKVLEEPPEKTIFLLVVNDIEKILPTILSRTQVVKVRPFSEEEIVHYLSKGGESTPECEHTAHLSDGNMNKALKLHNAVANDSADYFKQWMRECFSSNIGALITRSDDYQKLGKEAQKSLLQYGLNILRESLVKVYAADAIQRIPQNDVDFVAKFSTVLNDDKIIKLTELFNDAIFHLERNANPKIMFLDLSFQTTKTIKAK